MRIQMPKSFFALEGLAVLTYRACPHDGVEVGVRVPGLVPQELQNARLRARCVLIASAK